MNEFMRKMFVPDLNKINLKSFRFHMKLLLIFSSFMLVFFLAIIFYDYFSKEGALILPVREHYDENISSSSKTYKHFEYDHYSYITGTKGELYYKPLNLGEAILFQSLSGKTIIDYLVYFLISLFLFFRLRSITDRKSFSIRTITDFMWVSVVLFFLLPTFKYWSQELLLNPMLLRSTNGLFEMENTGSHIEAYPLLLIFMLLYFMKKGFELQEEQELTI